MSVEVVMPTLSDTMVEGTLLRWLKKPKDYVKKGDIIAEVETDKANMQVEAFEEGILLETLVEEGQTVPVGKPIARIDTENIETKDIEKEEEIITKTQAPPTEESTEPKERAPSSEDSQTEAAHEVPEKIQPPSEKEHYKASPAARKKAREVGIDLSAIQGSGPGGRIIEKDIVEDTEKRQKSLDGGLSENQKAIGQLMKQSKQEIPHFYVTASAKAQALLELLSDFKKTSPDTPITFTHLLIKACGKALKKHPRLNATYQEDNLVIHEDINLALAIALDDGLIAPVLHQIQRLSLEEVAHESAQLLSQAKAGRLNEKAFSQGTFTLSNLGMYGIESFSAIISPPQIAVLAVGTIQPIDSPSQAQVKLTLSADHRALNGVDAAQFLQTLCQYLENPILML